MKKNMKNNIVLSQLMVLVCVTMFSLMACSDDDKDDTKPVITDRDIVANPVNCQVYHCGDVIPFHYVFEDDTELGSFNIEVHDNSDHHSHSTESDDHEHEGEGECSHDEHHEHHEGEGTEQHWIYNRSFDIPAGQKHYDARIDIPIPNDIAPGDYHFMIRVTDRAGWMQLKAIAIIVEE